MQQWEYLVVSCGNDKVITVNEDKVGKIGFSSIKGEFIWDYLNLQGSEGWEVVSTTSTQYGELKKLILRRLVGQEAP